MGMSSMWRCKMFSKCVFCICRKYFIKDVSSYFIRNQLTAGQRNASHKWSRCKPRSRLDLWKSQKPGKCGKVSKNEHCVNVRRFKVPKAIDTRAKPFYKMVILKYSNILQPPTTKELYSEISWMIVH